MRGTPHDRPTAPRAPWRTSWFATRLRHVRTCTALVAASGLLIAGCGSPPSTAGRTLTLWHNYGTNANATAIEAIARDFEDENPGVHVDVVSQPQDNYFALLQSATIASSGPDLAVMWTGRYATKYQDLLVNLRGLVTDATLEEEKGMNYTAPGLDPARGNLVLPTDTQFYIGFSNRALFERAGLTGPPRTWAELGEACRALTAIGVTPIVYGNGGGQGGATFVPWIDASYLAAGVTTPEGLDGLATGRLAWTDPRLVAQLTTWQELEKDGCTNADVLTKTDNYDDFTSGRAAMIMDGSYNSAMFQKALGDDLVPFQPPYSDSPTRAVVEYPGSGIAVTKSVRDRRLAAQFVTYLTGATATRELERAGLIPNLRDYVPTDPLARELTGFATDGGATRYPMLDNIIQPEVAAAGGRQLPSVLASRRTPETALRAMRDVLENLPAPRRGEG